MQAVRNVARNGRTVIVTIHQPSIEVSDTMGIGAHAAVCLFVCARVSAWPPGL
jgi:archaellum biogenesis ATPase FlaH